MPYRLIKFALFVFLLTLPELIFLKFNYVNERMFPILWIPNLIFFLTIIYFFITSVVHLFKVFWPTMKKIFEKMDFPSAPGGDRYEWKKAETSFTIKKNALLAIKIVACCKNAKQNKLKDDDDLRISLDGYRLGKYEIHEEQISWKGFGTSASWDGSSLKGGVKTIYFFVNLHKGNHKIQFFADNKPAIKSVEVFEVKNKKFELSNLSPPQNLQTHRKGIPWISIIFLGTFPKNFLIDVKTKSAKEKKSSDGDNIKILVNGKILKNPRVPSSKKYGNFYFSGDVKYLKFLLLGDKELSGDLAFENAIDLWYDQEPEILNLKVEFFDIKQFLESLNLMDLRTYARIQARFVILGLKASFRPFSAKLLKHALQENPENIVLGTNSSIVKKIKADIAYKKILDKLKEKVSLGIMNGEIWPRDFKDDKEMNGAINFNSHDLATSLHGIRKIEYQAKQKNNDKLEVEMIFFDVYDFEREKIPSLFGEPKQYFKINILNAIDRAEALAVVKNFEIRIYVNDRI